MTRINTNVSSLNAQKTLAQSNAALQQSLNRLSTGLRINSGKDDPAGLIASEVLRADIVSVEEAISNSERANQMIATADSALGQVSSLLNDIRGLVSEAANKGALSADQMAANQLQIDSSLEAIDRIAQVTAFQGKRLLDGNLDFVTQDVDTSVVGNLQIDQANFGTASEISLGAEIVSQAEQAQLTFQGSQVTSDVVLEIGGSQGYEAFSFDAGSSVQEMADAINLVSDALGIQASLADRVAQQDSAGELKIMNIGGSNGFKVTAATAGQYDGDFTIKYVKDNTVTGATASWNAGQPNVIEVKVETTDWATAGSNAAQNVATNGGNGTLAIAAKFAGTASNSIGMDLSDSGGGAGVASVSYNYTTKRFAVSAGVGTTATQIATALTNAYGEYFTFTGVDGGASVQGADFKAYNDFTDATGVDGGGMVADLEDVAQAVAGLTQIENYVEATNIIGTKTEKVDIASYSGFIGDVNAGGSDDPNNRIQLSSTDLGGNMAIKFQTAGPSQAFSIDLTPNTRTNGKSTAYIQSSGGVLKVQADNQNDEDSGVNYEGIQVIIRHDATDKSVIYDKENKTITVWGDNAGETLNDLSGRINSALGTEFTATVIDDGAFVGDGTETGTTNDGAQYDAITVNLATDANGVVTTTAAEVVTALNASTALKSLGIAASNVTTSDGSGLAATGTVTLSQLGVTASNDYASATTYAGNGATAQVTVTAKNAGAAYNNVEIAFVLDVAAGSEYAEYDATSKVLTFHANAATTSNDLATAFTTGSATAQSVKDLFTVTGGGAGAVLATDTGYLTGGVTYNGTSQGGVDSEGNFDKDQVVGTAGLKFLSSSYGSDHFVSINALSGTFATVDANNTSTSRDYGTDANVRINGIGAVTKGLEVSLNTSTLDLSFTLSSSATSGSSTSFKIVSGGALFQLGPDVVSNQQARLGIQSVSSAKLGGTSGRLFQLKSGGTAALDTDTSLAASIVEEAITGVVTLRGRLGAFQSTTLDTNIASLSDTLEALTAAESSIRDADFAEESANLTRAQILVQAGTTVLSIANSNPQNVLALLQ